MCVCPFRSHMSYFGENKILNVDFDIIFHRMVPMQKLVSDLNLFFEVMYLKSFYIFNDESTKMTDETFIDFDICHRMAPL